MSNSIDAPKTVKALASQIKEARVDHSAFEVLLRPCEMSRCKATCCYDGVSLSQEEEDYISVLVRNKVFSNCSVFQGLNSDRIVVDGERGRKTATRPALPSEVADDFPKHFPKTRCVFLDSEGYCGLQKLAIEENLDPWVHKPLTCWMHPLVLVPEGKWEERPVLTIVNRDNDPQKKVGYSGYASCTHCGREDKSGQPAWQVLELELKRLGELCGRDIYGELSADEVDWYL